jgi:hypothetical protein
MNNLTLVCLWFAILGPALKGEVPAVIPDSRDFVQRTPPSDTFLPESKYGPAAALMFAGRYRGDATAPDVLHCYPAAIGVPFDDCENIVTMTAALWKPAELTNDFQRRMAALPAEQRKRGIIVLLKTERCATKWLRACTVTTSALEKRSTALAEDFLIYGVLLKPRDNDKPPGSLPIESGADAWKNDAAGEYQFTQGPGATLASIDPSDGAVFKRTDAVALDLIEREFLKNGGNTPKLHSMLEEVLTKMKS